MKIGPVDTEIALLNLKKRKKSRKVKYITRSAGLPSGLNKCVNDTGCYCTKKHKIAVGMYKFLYIVYVYKFIHCMTLWRMVQTKLRIS